ncbi:hypothetical protein AV530_005414 [Patagioenas fasciata monilis]|uniref:Uncharacterized protein n=1 Tax=Patagioenas fasciata monilis TaxID=372326 RepID=A0A1V4JLA4_PATFA|nr:hypothetical protein AV530_005414 [Patagioenas fasciata monilis]
MMQKSSHVEVDVEGNPQFSTASASSDRQEFVCAGKICVNLESEPRHWWTAPARWLAHHMLSTQTRKKDFLQSCLLTAMVPILGLLLAD